MPVRRFAFAEQGDEAARREIRIVIGLAIGALIIVSGAALATVALIMIAKAGGTSTRSILTTIVSGVSGVGAGSLTTHFVAVRKRRNGSELR